MALVVDRPGGPLDRIVADVDVTTFLNDRFHPLFEMGRDDQPQGTVRFFDGCGCPLTVASAPSTPAAFIALANQVIVREDWRACEGRPFSPVCTRPPGFPGAD